MTEKEWFDPKTTSMAMRDYLSTTWATEGDQGRRRIDWFVSQCGIIVEPGMIIRRIVGDADLCNMLRDIFGNPWRPVAWDYQYSDEPGVRTHVFDAVHHLLHGQPWEKNGEDLLAGLLVPALVKTWENGEVIKIAASIKKSGDMANMPVLGDALIYALEERAWVRCPRLCEKAADGVRFFRKVALADNVYHCDCEGGKVLHPLAAHCLADLRHFNGCWALELLSGGAA